MLDPISRFQDLLVAAERVDRTLLAEPTAFCLATADAAGRPSARMLLLKGVDREGFVFYTNLESRKGEDLRATKRAAMCFHWQPLEAQVRVEGTVAPVPDAEADAYFASRARASQLGAWASLQSRALPDPRDLETRLAEFEQRFAGVAVPRPPHWSGFRLSPEQIEFWRNRPSRLHERELYAKKEDGAWSMERLYP